jgi:hypothetical protein
MNEKLIKDGKIFNIETSTLIAVSKWYTYYKTQRQKLYKTAKGTFFKVTEIPKFGTMYVENVKRDCRCVLLNGGGKTLNITADRYSLNGGNGFRDDVIIDSVEVESVLTEVKARDFFEYIVKGGEFSLGHDHDSIKYRTVLTYSEVFELTEA